MFKKNKKSSLSELFPPRKKTSVKKKVLGVGLASAVVAAIAGAFAKERDSQ